MSISFNKENSVFTLKTKKSQYSFLLYENRFLIHLYYGKPIAKDKLSTDIKKHNSFAPYYKEFGDRFSPDNNTFEFPFFGNGDFRTSALKLRFQNGSCVTDFTYASHKIFRGRADIDGLPYADADDKTQTLAITMKDEPNSLTLTLYYTVFAECDVISRYFKLENKGNSEVKIEKAMSLCVDMPAGEYDYIALTGTYLRERFYQRNPVVYANQSLCSRRGASSHPINPFLCLCDRKTTEERGNAYGFNFVYSGSFLNEIEQDQNGTIRVMCGLGQDNFGYLIKKGEKFESPEAVMTYSAAGLGQISRNFHSFIRDHILPPDCFEKRPVVLNTWEASYFNIDEEKMYRFADSCAGSNIDMLVMDDGWFGHRDDDTSSLGDWYVCEKKFKNGLGSMIKRIKKSGLKFGIWIEPEMVNPNSDLYRAHPEWALGEPGRESLLSRHQLVLDMANPEVVDYLIKSFDETLGKLDIDYIKWDMNRNMSNVVSSYLPAERQDEVSFRYMLGVYRLYRWFNERFPNVMIENCSGGGGRFDLGMMKYSTQIWTSDQTHPGARVPIQHGTTYGYPTCVMSCHVSNAAGTAYDMHKFDFAYHVATNGALGYELMLPDLPQSTRDIIADQVTEYRQNEDTILRGDFYRVHNPQTCPYYSFYFVSRDKNQILATFTQNHAETPKKVKMKITAADKNSTYKDIKSGVVYTGEQLRKGIEFMSFDQNWSCYAFDFRKI